MIAVRLGSIAVSESYNQSASSRELPPARYCAIAASRGVALFIAFFTLLNLLLQWFTPRFDANHWWIDFGPTRLPHWLGSVILAVAAGVLGAYAVQPRMTPRRRRITLSTCEVLGLVAIWDAINYFALLYRKELYSGAYVPFSFLVVLALFIVWRGVMDNRQARGGRAWGIMAVTVFVCAVLFPLGQIACFGTTDYRHYAGAADVIVVFGAGVDSDGRPSDALRDRVDLAVDLYKDQVRRGQPPPLLIFTGAQGNNEPLAEAEAMKKIARDAGVSSDDIELDPAGYNTESSVRETAAMIEALRQDLKSNGSDRILKVLVVSHFFHLPRIKMAYEQQEGPNLRWLIYTVPVQRPLERSTWYTFREIGAQWAYYFRAFAGK